MVKKQIRKEIDRTIKQIWLTEISKDYGDGLLLKERALQCSFYHYLRNDLEPVLEENHLCIYPEFHLRGFGERGYQADLAICEMDFNRDTYWLKEKVKDVITIIELKYGGSEAWMSSDLSKIKEYAKKLSYDCQYYFASIDERGSDQNRNSWTQLNWLDGRSTGAWADGCFTELNAGWLDGEMVFEVMSYNHMNTQQERVTCEFRW